MSSGNGFVKIDFHVHSPVSMCYDHDYRSIGPEEIVDAAIRCGLDGFAITDHNTAQNIPSIREAAKAKGILFFPGMELTTPGGHVLAYFDPDCPISVMNGLLRDVGISPDQEGNPWTETKDWITEVFEKIAKAGGIAVAAHIERGPRGFMEQVKERSTRQKIHSSEYLTALEITLPSWKKLWNQGSVAGFPKKYPVIQGSDAHAPKEMGMRPVFVKLPTPSIQALQQALANHTESLLFPEEYSVSTE